MSENKPENMSDMLNRLAQGVNDDLAAEERNVLDQMIDEAPPITSEIEEAVGQMLEVKSGEMLSPMAEPAPVGEPIKNSLWGRITKLMRRESSESNQSNQTSSGK